MGYEWPISQPLAFRRLYYPLGPFTVRHFARVPAKLKFREVTRQMFFTDVMKCTDQPALQEAVVTLREICV